MWCSYNVLCLVFQSSFISLISLHLLSHPQCFLPHHLFLFECLPVPCFCFPCIFWFLHQYLLFRHYLCQGPCTAAPVCAELRWDFCLLTHTFSFPFVTTLPPWPRLCRIACSLQGLQVTPLQRVSDPGLSDQRSQSMGSRSQGGRDTGQVQTCFTGVT